MKTIKHRAFWLISVFRRETSRRTRAYNAERAYHATILLNYWDHTNKFWHTLIYDMIFMLIFLEALDILNFANSMSGYDSTG